MAKKKHRAINVNNDHYISLCETCKYMPEGQVPRNNREVQEKAPKHPYMLCLRKAYAPIVEYDNDGNPFYDVAECDGYEDIYSRKEEKKTPKRRKQDENTKK